MASVQSLLLICAVALLGTLQAATITETVVAEADLSSLEAAVIAAGQSAVLSQAGPFTLFAPTDAAFSTVSEQTNTLIANANSGTQGPLQQLLQV